MLDELLYVILHSCYDSLFISFDEGALERAELEQLAAWNRGLALALLVPGCFTLLPFTLAAFFLALPCAVGQKLLFGVDVACCFGISVVGMMVLQFVGVVLLSILCSLRMEWEPRGVVLALAGVLHTTPRVLQNIWRAMGLLPFVACVLLVIR